MVHLYPLRLILSYNKTNNISPSVLASGGAIINRNVDAPASSCWNGGLTTSLVPEFHNVTDTWTFYETSTEILTLSSSSLVRHTVTDINTIIETHYYNITKTSVLMSPTSAVGTSSVILSYSTVTLQSVLCIPDPTPATTTTPK